MPAAELEKQDLALLNLRCAEGLPGSEDLDIEKCLAKLDNWASVVQSETERHYYKYQQNPEEYENSEAYYRMMMLITVVQQDFGVHYNPERIREVDFTKSKDLFLHGLVGSDNGGTCVSMPVLYTAVAQRLDYPVHLVIVNAHVFCRWDEPGERFNIEATSQGMNSFADRYYMTWPKPITEAQVRAGWYLNSLSTNEAFAEFLATRGHCLQDNRSGAKARVAYAMAHEKRPQHPLYIGFLAQTIRPPGQSLASQNPPLVYPPSPAWQQNRSRTGIRVPRLHHVAKPYSPGAGVPGQFYNNATTGFSAPVPGGFGYQPR